MDDEASHNSVGTGGSLKCKRIPTRGRMMSHNSPGQEPVIRIGSLIPEDQQLLSVEPDDSVYTAISYMKRHNYSQLPVMDANERFFGVISWRSIGERYTSPGSPSPGLVSHCMDSQVHPLSGNQSLFDPETIKEIDKQDYIVLKDEANMVVGIVTAADLATRFERFGSAFALIGEIDLRLRRLMEYKLSDKEIRSAQKKNLPKIYQEDGSEYKLGFGEYVWLFHNRTDTLGRPDGSMHFASDINRARLIRNRLMHFAGGNLEEATDEEMGMLRDILEKVRKME